MIALKKFDIQVLKWVTRAWANEISIDMAVLEIGRLHIKDKLDTFKKLQRAMKR